MGLLLFGGMAFLLGGWFIWGLYRGSKDDYHKLKDREFPDNALDEF